MHRRDLEAAPADVIRARQLDRLDRLLDAILPHNRFYAAKLGHLERPITWETFRTLPFTTKEELVADQAEEPPLGTIATYAHDRYAVYHQTSGTTGRPLTVLDTAESWNWWAESWQYVYRGAGVTERDRVFFAFSFGPFIGFWSAYAGARTLGALTVPGGAMNSATRLAMIRHTGASVLVSTPTYALRLAEVAKAEGHAIREGTIRITIHAGEPGASIPATRRRIEEAWNARCFDHAGATEIGAYGYSCAMQDGLHANEEEFIVEVLAPDGRPVAPEETGELVVTNLGRPGWPAIRYRTGDLVTLGDRQCPCGRTFLKLPGGLLGRSDDLIIHKGVNIYPSSIESIVREFEVHEFRLVRTRRAAIEDLELEVESTPETAAALANRILERLAVRIACRVVDRDSLPRWELKARRVTDRREENAP